MFVKCTVLVMRVNANFEAYFHSLFCISQRSNCDVLDTEQIYDVWLIIYQALMAALRPLGTID